MFSCEFKFCTTSYCCQEISHIPSISSLMKTGPHSIEIAGEWQSLTGRIWTAMRSSRSFKKAGAFEERSTTQKLRSFVRAESLNSSHFREGSRRLAGGLPFSARSSFR